MPKFGEVRTTHLRVIYLGIWDPPKSDKNISLIINNTATHLPIVFKFSRLVRHEILRLKNFANPLSV